MTHLLDVNTLIALIWTESRPPFHRQSMVRWQDLALCPISELGFIRISTSQAFNLSMPDARKALHDFISDENPRFIPCDLRAMDGDPAPSSGKITDWYLANLAGKHRMKLATLDAGLKHPAAEIL
jgi:predicted nucleic acid-binding protein